MELFSVVTVLVLASSLSTCLEEGKDEDGQYKRDGEFYLKSKPSAPDYVGYLKAIGVPESKMKIMTSPTAKVTMTIRKLKPEDKRDLSYNFRFVSKTAAADGGGGEVGTELNYVISGNQFVDTEFVWMNDQKCNIIAFQTQDNICNFRIIFRKHEASMTLRYESPVTTLVELAGFDDDGSSSRTVLTFERVKDKPK